MQSLVEIDKRTATEERKSKSFFAIFLVFCNFVTLRQSAQLAVEVCLFM